MAILAILAVLRVSVVKILNLPPARAAVPAGTAARLEFRQKPAITIAGARPCGLAHSVPPTSPGATTAPAAKMSGSQAAGNARVAAVQFGCDSARRQWMGGAPAGVPSGPDELAEDGTRSYMSQPAVILDNLVKQQHRTFSLFQNLVTAKDAKIAKEIRKALESAVPDGSHAFPLD